MSRSIQIDSPEQQVRNLHRFAGAPGDTLTAFVAVYMSSNPFLSSITTPWGSGMRLTLNANETTSSFLYITTVTNNSAGPLVTPGTTYTMSLWARSSRTMQAYVIIPWRNSAGSNFTQTQGNIVTISANTWMRLSLTAVAPAGSVTGGLRLLRADSVLGVTGDTLDMAGLMFTEGNTLWDYADGSMPGWKWDGTANASSSVGYPYTLPRLAGNPAGSYVAANPQANASATPSPLLASNSPRTALFMYEMTGTTNNPAQFAIVRHGSTVAGQTRIRLMTSVTTGQLQLIVFAGNWNGSSGTDGAQAYANLPFSAGTVGKHVLALTWDGTISSTATLLWNSDGTEGSMIFDAGTGLTDGGSIYGYYTASVSNSGAGYILKDTTTTARIAAIKWLANRYGVPLN